MPNLFGIDVSDEVYALNQYHLQVREPKTQARKDIDAELKQQFARQFEAQWQLLDGPPLRKEFYFYPSRDWRADYLVIDTMWLIELEGGIWSGGRHTRAKGFIDDCYKYNMAAMLGYRVIRIATGMANADYISQIIEGIR